MTDDAKPSGEAVTKITVSGADMSFNAYQRLTSVRVEREFRMPARATLVFDYPHALGESEGVADYLIAVGTAIEISCGGESLIQAEVVSLELDQAMSGNTATVTALDASYALGRTASHQTYTKGTLSSIVTTIANAAGMSPKVTAPAFPVDYLLQVETQLDLLNALADHAGCDWWVTGKTLNFAIPSATAPITLTLAQGLDSWRVRVVEPVVSTATVTSRQPKSRTVLVGTTAANSGTGVAADSKIVTLGQKKSKPGKVLVARMPADSQGEAKAVATGIVDRAASSAVTGEGVCDVDPKIVPGAIVKIASAGPADGTYPVNGVTHVLRARHWQTRFTTGERTPHALVDMLGGGHNPSLKHLGLVAAFVTNNNDPESLGRVKVRYPELDNHEGPAAESDWARIVTLGGGDKRGNVSMPEIDDEVLVGFENGNLRYPVVLGGLYGDKASFPPVTLEGGLVPIRRTTSRLGHYTEFGDGNKPAEQHLKTVIVNGPTQRLGADNSEITWSSPSGPLTITWGQCSLTFDSSGNISMKGIKISIEAQQELAMKAPKITMAGSATLEMSGQASAKLTSGSMVEINGGGMTKISGGVVQVN